MVTTRTRFQCMLPMFQMNTSGTPLPGATTRPSKSRTHTPVNRPWVRCRARGRSKAAKAVERKCAPG